ncbi:NAD-dependent epimerase/dehydratase family protein [Larkinella ripae]
MSVNPPQHEPTVLLTGPNGFLGKHLTVALVEAGFRVLKLGRTEGDIRCDLALQQPDLSGKVIQVVVHAAGKAHSIPRTEKEKQAFFQTNEIGTIRLLRALEMGTKLPDAFVFISTVAVYGCEDGDNISETTELNGRTPYAESKIQAEQAVQTWCQIHGVRYLILRLPLLVGEEAPGNLGKLVRAIRRGRYVRIGDGAARRSMVLAGDVARLIPKAAQIGGIYNLTDGVHPSVRELSDAIVRQTGRRWALSIPIGLARLAGRLGDGLAFLTGKQVPINSPVIRKLTSSLTFSDQKARQFLGWDPRPVSAFYHPDFDSNLHPPKRAETPEKVELNRIL